MSKRLPRVLTIDAMERRLAYLNRLKGELRQFGGDTSEVDEELRALRKLRRQTRARLRLAEPLLADESSIDQQEVADVHR